MALFLMKNIFFTSVEDTIKDIKSGKMIIIFSNSKKKNLVYISLQSKERDVLIKNGCAEVAVDFEKFTGLYPAEVII
jgi:3,4-dihydroxy-2-butanone 4-phosphate synthase